MSNQAFPMIAAYEIRYKTKDHCRINNIVKQVLNCSYLVSYKTVGPSLWFEMPHHEASVHGACSKLLHVRVETHAGYSVSVAFEVTFQAWVFLQK